MPSLLLRLHNPSSDDVRPMDSSRENPIIRTKPSFTSRILPSSIVEIMMAYGLARNAFENFSSESRSALSMHFWSVTSCAIPRTIGVLTPSVRRVLWYSQILRSPVLVRTAIKPLTNPSFLMLTSDSSNCAHASGSRNSRMAS